MLNQDQPASASQSVGFIPPAPTQAIVKICQVLWPAYARASEFRLTVHLDPSVKSVFNQLKNARLIICPNHSAHDDPVVAFALSAQLDEQFYFLTAREIFMWHPSLRSLWLQHLGCYSVLRASADVEAFKATRDLLLDGPNKIVVFPEGEVTHQNRFVMSLEEGTERMALNAAQALQGKGSDEPIYLMPIGIAYRYRRNITEQLDKILSNCEKRLAIGACRDGSFTPPIAQRVETAFDKMMRALEDEHQIARRRGQTLGERVNQFIEHTISDIAELCHVVVPHQLSQREKLHALKKVFINHRYTQASPLVSSAERVMYKQIRRAVNLIGIGDRAFANLNSMEALAELILIIENEVMGRVSLRAARDAYVANSKPIDVREFLPLYKSDKDAAVRELADALRTGINDALVYLAAAHPEHFFND